MKTDKIYLVHILECIDHIESYTLEGKNEFIKSKLIQDAVIRNLGIIGEATKKISLDLRDRYSNLPWREMAGLRDVLVHDYFGVDIKIVWTVVDKELPKVKESVLQIMEEEKHENN
ncbi:MAG: DUF86 domain-containing protein [Alkaliphilus sp.]